MTTETSSIKIAAHKLVDTLPDDATWDDLEYAIYVRKEIEAGIADADAGRTHTSEEVKRLFGLE